MLWNPIKYIHQFCDAFAVLLYTLATATTVSCVHGGFVVKLLYNVSAVRVCRDGERDESQRGQDGCDWLINYAWSGGRDWRDSRWR